VKHYSAEPRRLFKLPPVPVKEGGTAEFLVYTAQAGEKGIAVRVEDGTIWLTQKLISTLFEVDVRTVSEHLKNVFASGELAEQATLRNFRTVQTEGGREVTRSSAAELALDGVPTLAEALASLVGVPTMGEVKQDALLARIGPLERAVAELVTAHPGPVCIASFQPRTLAWFARHRPDLARVLTVGRRLVPGVRLLAPDALSVDLARLHEPRWGGWRDRGLPVLAWTVRDAEGLATARGLADGIVFEHVRP
jgi:glycerophosphoryl diester phosphodiesterase